MKKFSIGLVIAALLAFAVSCSVNKKLATIQQESLGAQIELSNEVNNLPDLSEAPSIPIRRDTIKVKDAAGNEMTLMSAVKDEETGEMVATEVLNQAVVTARFRNIAERHGKVDIGFQIVVPERMQDSKWQLRFNPDMFLLGDSIRLDPVIITGADYRKAQLRGYQQYERFLSRIINDSTKFIDIKLLEIFLERNIPQIYAFKNDSSYVSDEVFESFYGVSEQDAIDHYTNKSARRANERRKSMKDKKFQQYVKAPIVTEGIRLDTVIRDVNGDFIYNYVQTINTRPKLRRVDIVISGDIYEQEKKLYDIPKSDPLTFYISSISSFAMDVEKYLSEVIQRRVAANTDSHIDFETGRAEIKPELGRNMEEIEMIKRNLASLMDNKTFDLDSIVVSATASPEGSFQLNKSLAQARSESVSSYFNKYMKTYLDSLNREKGFSVNVSDVAVTDYTPLKVTFTPRCIPENWDDLRQLVAKDDTLTIQQKDDFLYLCEVYKNEDERELKMRANDSYDYIKNNIYPRLRTVKFNFYLHRKGMVQDTVSTTVLDTNYMKGVKCLKDMDYEEALKYLRPYNDFNTAVAYAALYRDQSAMSILSPMDPTAEVCYLKAILFSRMGNMESAVNNYLTACSLNTAYIHRGNLDPEISQLIKAYGLNTLTDDYLSVDYGDLY